MTAASGITTVIAGKVAGASGTPREEAPFAKLAIGEHLKLQVVRELEQHRYEMAFGGRRHVVESRVPLTVGSQVEARVESKGEKLVLRYIDAQAEVAARGGTRAAQAPLDALAAQFRVPLDAASRSAIERAAARASDPDLMTRGGLFLQKLAQQVNARDLEVLYRALRPESGGAPAMAQAAQASVTLENLLDTDDVAGTLADALDSAPTELDDAAVRATGEDGGDDAESRDDGRRALRLLNLQDEGSVAWRFGTLPLLVGGRLVELDLVMFREREPAATRGALRRLVMTLETTHFGRVHVEARALDGRLIVKLSAPDADAVEVLSGYGADVRAAIERLGWAVDDVRYELAAPNAGAAQSIVQHVLSAGTVDQEL